MLPPYLPPAEMHQQAGEWQAQGAGAASLPAGWTDEALAVVVGMAAQFGTTPADLMALFWSESGAQPRINSAGLAQITTPAQEDMRWPKGAWAQIVAGPLPAQLAGISAWWTHLETRYVRATFATKASAWNVPVSTVIYAFHAFPSRAANATSAQSILVSSPETAYQNNAGLDRAHKNTITVGDLAARIASKGREMGADPFGGSLLSRLELVAQSGPPSLAEIWASYAEYYQRATGQAIPTPSGSDAPSRSRLWLAVGALALGAAVWPTQRARR